MLFNSYIFIFCFLPITLLGYYILSKYNKYVLAQAYLLIASLIFYAYFNIKYLPIICISILVNYITSRLILKNKDKKIKKLILIIGLFINLGIFVYFKYYDFFIDNINIVFSTSFILKKIVLPLGISFFSFQQISYLVDVYRDEVPNYSFLDYASFVAFFPQLIAGPIVLHNEIIPQFLDNTKKRFNYKNFSKGMTAFTIGLAKKVLIADIFGKAVNAAHYNLNNISQLNSTTAILVALSFTIQIYFDFSGYCDMATGLGLMFNIDIAQNFNSPYKSLTVSEFWQRWHMTLTRFFKRYVYIPLGGNRKGRLRTYFNIFIVFVLSGFWHGANWTFILWGAMHGIGNVFTKLFDKHLKKMPKIILWITTFGFINVTWVYFRANDINSANTLVKRVISMSFGSLQPSYTKLFLPKPIEFLVSDLLNLSISKNCLALICLLTYIAIAFILVSMKNTNQIISKMKFTKLSSVLIAITFTIATISLVGVTTFLYFNF